MRISSLLCLIAGLPLLVACGEPPAPAESAVAAASRPAEETVFEWKMITSWPKNLPAVGTSPEEFSERVARMTNGRLQIRVYGANELVHHQPADDSARAFAECIDGGDDRGVLSVHDFIPCATPAAIAR